ncbi:TonB-dependent receptor domain-containing protein [Horticoccus sp. 23ND18S-11]|uniref:TonB-dependent receptor domain-containing protein n=1 Tax=Horticoccus sp. 23ND18S-11 TaxID=3391832 RepID=UPI0039C9D9EF
MFRRLRTWLGACLGALVFAGAAWAADTALRFDIPAGDAADTLKLAAQQGGLEIAFFAETVRGVHTPALRGTFAPREVLERLVAGTGLSIVSDRRDGTLTVRRSTPPTNAAPNEAARSPTSPDPPPSMKSRTLLTALGSWLAVAMTPATSAAAQARKPDANTDESVKLAAFVVTGSNIPTASDALAAPVTIINRDEIERTGLASNLLEVVQARMPSFAGSGNLGATNGNIAGGTATSGGAQISLRNLSTLVLLDGRRLPDSGASARGGRSFVDVNQIPLAAIQSMEVLTDGASAIYGSDAVGGVVNVKLKHDYQGLEVGGRYAMSTRDGNYTQRSAYLVAGAKTDRFSLTLSFSKSNITPLFQSERPFSNPQRGKSATISGALGQSSTAFPTAFLRSDLKSPSLVTPTGPAAAFADLAALVASGIYQASSVQPIADTFDLAPFVTLTIESRKQAITLASTVKLIPERLEMFVEAMDSLSESWSQQGALGITTTVPVNAPYNPTRSSLFAAFRYTPDVRRAENSAQLRRLVGGFRGKIGDRLQWEAGYNTNTNRLENSLSGQYYSPNLQLALAGGYDANGNSQVGGRYARLFRNQSAPSNTTTLAQWQAAITPANSIVQPAIDLLARPEGLAPSVFDNIRGATANSFEAELTQLDARVSGSLLELPAGPLGAALGVDFREEKLVGTPDENSFSSGPTSRRWQNGNFFDPISRKRTIEAGFAEIRVPVTNERMNLTGLRLLELSAAYRYEKYSDAGASRVPKYGVRWRPVGDELTVRGTYSEAFVAPSLFALFGPTTEGATAAGVIQTVFGVPGFARQRSGANPDLKPSTAKTTSFGAVYSPKALQRLTLGIDYIEVRQLSLVGVAGAANILGSVNTSGTRSPFVSQVAIGNFPTNPDPSLPPPVPVTNPGQLSALLQSGVSPNVIFITDSRINIAGQKLKALDVSATYEFPKSEFGNFNLSTAGTFFIDYQFQALPTQSYYEYAGHVTTLAEGQGTIPGMKWFTALSWSRDRWSATLNNTYISSVVDLGAGGIIFASSTSLKRVQVPSYLSWDTSVSYAFKHISLPGGKKLLSGLKLTVGVNNVADKMPPSAPQAFGSDVGVDLATYNPIGRLWYVSAGLKF